MTADDEFIKLCSELPPADKAALAARLGRQRADDGRSAYHRTIVARATAGRDEPVPELPPGGYETYTVQKGKHYRTERADLEAARERYDARCKAAREAGKPTPDWLDPKQKEYRPGDEVTPETDGEALLMVQDPEKFRRKVPGAPPDRIADLLLASENEELRKRIAALEAAGPANGKKSK
jgi:hypothetical protein